MNQNINPIKQLIKIIIIRMKYQIQNQVYRIIKTKIYKVFQSKLSPLTNKTKINKVNFILKKMNNNKRNYMNNLKIKEKNKVYLRLSN